jgi:hypothetical protein
MRLDYSSNVITEQVPQRCSARAYSGYSDITSLSRGSGRHVAQSWPKRLRTTSRSQAVPTCWNGRKPAWLRPFVAARCRASLPCYQLDKLGVTGSSPVPPTSRKPRSGGVFLCSAQPRAGAERTRGNKDGNTQRRMTFPQGLVRPAPPGVDRVGREAYARDVSHKMGGGICRDGRGFQYRSCW